MGQGILLERPYKASKRLVRPRIAHRSPKIVKIGPKWFKIAPRWPKRSPREHKEGPMKAMRLRPDEQVEAGTQV